MTESKLLTGYPSVDKPWLKFYSDNVINAPLPEATLYEHITKCNADNLDRIALNYYGAKTSYRAFFYAIDQTASALEQCGIKHGDNVSVIMLNSPETIFLMFALNKIGAVANMVYGADTPVEIKRHIVDANSTVLFVLDVFQDKILEIINETPLQMVIVSNLMQGMSLFNRLGAALLKKLKTLPLPNDSRFISWKVTIQSSCRLNSYNNVFNRL